MKLLYIGKKAPITFKMGFLSKEYTFKNTEDPVEVEREDAKRLLAENPNMLRVVGDQGGFVFVEEEKETPIPDADDGKKDPDAGDKITKESLEELTKAEIGTLIQEKFDVELTINKNKEAVISDALAIAAAA